MSGIILIFAPSKRNIAQIMTTRREKSKPQKPQMNKLVISLTIGVILTNKRKDK